jgi:hypothetical protein
MDFFLMGLEREREMESEAQMCLAFSIRLPDFLGKAWK